jgi:hypothetical protein
MFAALCKALVPANVTPARRTLVHCETEPTLVLSVALLVREASARANDLVILRESDVGMSLDVIHSNFGGLNSTSSRHRGRQKSVSPSEEKLILAWDYEWDSLLIWTRTVFRKLDPSGTSVIPECRFNRKPPITRRLSPTLIKQNTNSTRQDSV